MNNMKLYKWAENPWIGMGALFFLNLFVKGYFLQSQSLASDEAFTIYHAQLPVKELVGRISTGNNPPLFELFLHYWIHLFGNSEWVVRLPSLIFSAFTPVVVFFIGRRFFDHSTGLLASLLITFATYHISFAHEARVYALFGLLTACAYYLFLLVIHAKQIVVFHYILLAAIHIALIYAHYFGFFVLMLQGVFILWKPSVRKKIGYNMLWVFIGVFIAYIPNIWVLLFRFIDSTHNGTWIKPVNSLDSFYYMLVEFANAPVVAVLVLLIFALRLVVKKPSNPPNENFVFNQRFIALVVWLPFVFLFIVSIWIPVFKDRYLMFVSVTFYLFLAIQIQYLSRFYWVHKFAYIGILVAFIATAKWDYFNFSDSTKLMNTVNELRGKDTDNSQTIAFCPQHFFYVFTYYYDKKIFNESDTLILFEKLAQKNIFPIRKIEDLDFKSFDTLIYLDLGADFSHPGNNILPFLNQHTHSISSDSFNKVNKLFKFHK